MDKQLGHSSMSLVARLFGVSNSSVGAWASRGCPRNGDGTFDLRLVIGWRLDVVARRDAPAAKSATLEEKRKLEVEKLELDLQERRGELVSRAEALQSFRVWTRRFRTMLDDIARACRNKCGKTITERVKDGVEEIESELKQRGGE